MAGRRAGHRRQRGGTILLYADRTLYDLYGFHLNGFSIGLLVSPGGLSSLGSGDGTLLSASLAALALLCLQVLLYSACQVSRERLPALPRRAWRLLAAFSAWPWANA